MSTTATPTDRKTFPTDPSKVKTGDLMAIITYVKVKDAQNAGNNVRCVDLNLGTEFAIQGKELVAAAFSADYYAEEVELSRTEVCRILVNSPNRPLSLEFVKKPEKGKLVGDDRVLKGRFIAEVPFDGRSFCEDLEIAKDDPRGRMREVDHRTIKWLIVDGVKYTVKKR